MSTSQHSLNGELLISLKKGDENTFGYIFDAFYEKLLAFTIGYTKDKAVAEDIVQQSFIKLWEKRKNLAEDTVIDAYLFTLCRNNFIDRYRKERNTILLTDELYLESVLESESESDEKTAYKKQLLHKAITKLPEKCKEVFLLKQNENLRNKEIAAYLKISEKTVEDHISRAMRLLRRELLVFLIFMFL
ncbi:RNA polymerase sigma-70 factor [Zunongwangia sp. HRR-M8]|uniref:RNA polymerase sigma-70 factor n=1 Tax=Zunongwangia sp. HRR-M8 TaxID=3015170 RepID=UPI0022DD7FFB|nr:RNA polymerase sigma-70 factor [Zunongwangia sp. HRR-M8]WBL23007.1 RNA polymerase sigma-70 factor [Zunongwangia sp. HRR-M8]